ncbi:MAG: hypothetical protein KDA74_03590 [Planctomycetaceae bacterium]|nr:hypothetical protein [Planctomycetaceae bacterium]
MNETPATVTETVKAKSDRKTLVLPLLIICIGTGWLLTTLGIVPNINWIWTLGLAGIGILSFAVSGIDKSTVLTGPFFIIASCLSVMRQTGRITLDVEVPILVIVVGCLLLIARSKKIPMPDWMVLEEKQQQPVEQRH